LPAQAVVDEALGEFDEEVPLHGGRSRLLGARPGARCGRSGSRRSGPDTRRR
jgi:hypothetical protein